MLDPLLFFLLQICSVCGSKCIGAPHDPPRAVCAAARLLPEQKNVCREHSFADHVALERFVVLVDHIKTWANSLTTDDQTSARVLLAVTGSNDDARKIENLALLATCKHSPKMQFFAECR